MELSKQIEKFIAAECLMQEGSEVQFSRLYRLYKNWCYWQQALPLSRHGFAAALLAGPWGLTLALRPGDAPGKRKAYFVCRLALRKFARARVIPIEAKRFVRAHTFHIDPAAPPEPEPAAQVEMPQAPVHTQQDKEKREAALDVFAEGIKRRLDEQAAKGYSGWDGAYPDEKLARELKEDAEAVAFNTPLEVYTAHFILRRKLLDIGARAMMLYYRSQQAKKSRG